MTTDDETSGSGDDAEAGGATATRAELEKLREENERLRAQLAVGPDGVSHTSRRRDRVSLVMAVLGAILLVVSVLGVWTRNVVLDTDRYVDTVAPLATDSEVQKAVSDRIATAVSDAADIKSLAQDALPEEASFLAAPIAAGADNLIDKAADKVVESDQFAKAWDGINRTAHDALVAALTGKEGKVLDFADGQVVLELQPLVSEALALIDDQLGTDLESKIPTDKLNAEFVLFDSSQLASIQREVSIMDTTAWIAVVLTLGLLIGSIAVAVDRRKGVLHVGVGIAISMFVVIVGMALGRELFLSNLPDVVENPLAVAATFDILTRFVLQAVRFLFVLGLVLSLGAWVLGPGSVAGKVRGFWNGILGRGSDAATQHVGLGPVPGFCAKYLTGLRVAVLVVAGLVLVIISQPTGMTVVVVAAVAVVFLAVLQFLAGMAGVPERSAGDAPAQ